MPKYLVALLLALSSNPVLAKRLSKADRRILNECERFLAPSANPDLLIEHLHTLQGLSTNGRLHRSLEGHYDQMIQNTKQIVQSRGSFTIRRNDALYIIDDPLNRNPGPLEKLNRELNTQAVSLVFNPRILIENESDGSFDVSTEFGAHLYGSIESIVTGELDAVMIHELCHKEHDRQRRAGTPRPYHLQFVSSTGESLLGSHPYFSEEELDCYDTDIRYQQGVKNRPQRWIESMKGSSQNGYLASLASIRMTVAALHNLETSLLDPSAFKVKKTTAGLSLIDRKSGIRFSFKAKEKGHSQVWIDTREAYVGIYVQNLENLMIQPDFDTKQIWDLLKELRLILLNSQTRQNEHRKRFFDFLQQLDQNPDAPISVWKPLR